MIVRNKCHRFRRAVRSSRSNKDRGAYVYVQKRLIKEGALVVITGFPIKSSTARIHQICRIRVTISISLARPFTSRSSMRRDGRDRRRFSTSSLFLSPTLSLSLSLVIPKQASEFRLFGTFNHVPGPRYGGTSDQDSPRAATESFFVEFKIKSSTVPGAPYRRA